MDEYTPSTYGDRIADIYDARYPSSGGLGDPAVAAALLHDLAGDGPARERGIGTGRIALPLRASGVRVHGIDASTAMVGQLRAKSGGADIPVTIGDFRDFSFEERFRLVYVVFNTFFGLLTQDDQVACFQTIARHLTEAGVFVMEAFVPDPTRWDRGQRVGAVDVGTDMVDLEVSMHDPVGQRTTSQHVVLREGVMQLYPVRIRYAYVSELDLMARLAGLRLRDRFGDWDRRPFSAESGKHVSVWEPAP
jgi:SAM-dependent methyltransferase